MTSLNDDLTPKSKQGEQYQQQEGGGGRKFSRANKKLKNKIKKNIKKSDVYTAYKNKRSSLVDKAPTWNPKVINDEFNIKVKNAFDTASQSKPLQINFFFDKTSTKNSTKVMQNLFESLKYQTNAQEFETQKKKIEQLVLEQNKFFDGLSYKIVDEQVGHLSVDIAAKDISPVTPELDIFCHKNNIMWKAGLGANFPNFTKFQFNYQGQLSKQFYKKGYIFSLQKLNLLSQQKYLQKNDNEDNNVRGLLAEKFNVKYMFQGLKTYPGFDEHFNTLKVSYQFYGDPLQGPDGPRIWEYSGKLKTIEAYKGVTFDDIDMVQQKLEPGNILSLKLARKSPSLLYPAKTGKDYSEDQTTSFNQNISSQVTFKDELKAQKILKLKYDFNLIHKLVDEDVWPSTLVNRFSSSFQFSNQNINASDQVDFKNPHGFSQYIGRNMPEIRHQRQQEQQQQQHLNQQQQQGQNKSSVFYDFGIKNVTKIYFDNYFTSPESTFFHFSSYFLPDINGIANQYKKKDLRHIIGFSAGLGAGIKLDKSQINFNFDFFQWGSWQNKANAVNISMMNISFEQL